MAFDINTVKAYGAIAPDVVIQARISSFSNTYACLTSSYSQDKADDIANSYVAGGLITQFSGGQTTGKRAANGASVSFKQTKYGDSGEFDHPLIQYAHSIDDSNCLPSSAGAFAIGVGGTTPVADNPQ